MAPASAGPQPPSDRSDITRHTAGSPQEQAEYEHEACGPLEIERHVKDDGRALILYTRREHEDG